MATMHTRSAPASGLPFYLWDVPGKQIAIQLYFDVIDRMQPDILRGLGALKRRGAEVGGILLGRSEQGSPRKIIVEDFEPVPSEYLTGPSYNLSENDRVAFEAAIERRRSIADRSGLTVVGFYRSHTRDSLFMDDADIALAKRYFAGPGNAFLLIKPFASRTSIGGFFFWENGAINRESTYLQFPFHRGELGGGEPEPAPAAPAPQPEPKPTPPPPRTPSADAPREPPVFRPAPAASWPVPERSKPPILPAPLEARPTVGGIPGWRWMLVPVVLSIAVVAAFFAYREIDVPKAQVIPPVVETALPLKLSVADREHQLEVTWDRNSAAIAQARRGVLSISDGGNKRDLELTGAQLRTGRVLYSRISGDVSLRLEVFGERPDPATESIRIVSSEPARAPRQAPSEPQLAPVATESPVEEKPKPAPVQPAARVPARPAPNPVRRSVESLPIERPPAPTPEPAQPEIELQRPTRRR